MKYFRCASTSKAIPKDKAIKRFVVRLVQHLKNKIMPITSTNPITVDGNVYPYYMINLAISPLVNPTDIELLLPPP
jgi:ribosomal protein S26